MPGTVLGSREITLFPTYRTASHCFSSLSFPIALLASTHCIPERRVTLVQQSKARPPSKGLSWASLGRHEHAPLPTGRPGLTQAPPPEPHCFLTHGHTSGSKHQVLDPPLFPQAGPEQVHSAAPDLTPGRLHPWGAPAQFCCSSLPSHTSLTELFLITLDLQPEPPT